MSGKEAGHGGHGHGHAEDSGHSGRSLQLLVFGMSQVQHLGIARDMVSNERGAGQIVGQPIIMSDAVAEIRRPPPAKGEHTAEILAEFDFSEDEIASFNAKGTV